MPAPRCGPTSQFGDRSGLPAGGLGSGAGNKGARTAGVDGLTAHAITAGQGVEEFLHELRWSLKDRSFRPVPVRERMIPKAGGKLRRLGIPTVADRVVQASLKLVSEPIFEADFHPCSYGFRPRRRAHHAVAEVRYLASKPRCYEWIVEGDIKACFDEIDHSALLGRVRTRIGDRRVMGLVKAFLMAGVLTEDGMLQDTTAGTPQGGQGGRGRHVCEWLHLWRFDDVDGVDPGQAGSGDGPRPRRASLVTAGCEARVKARGPLFHPGSHR